MECSICGVSGKERNVLEVISPTGIILACERCSSEEGFPVLRRPKSLFFEQPKENKTMHERLSSLSGVSEPEREKPELKEQEERLRKITNERYEQKIKEKPEVEPRSDLVENFHWILMRVRRMKGLTQQQLAEKIGEPESAIKMAEQGIVPEGYKLLDKLESFFKVKLIEKREIISSTSPEKPFTLEKDNLDNITISDLQRMKEEREALEESSEDKREGSETL